MNSTCRPEGVSKIEERIERLPCLWRPLRLGHQQTEIRRAWVHTSEGSREARDGILRNQAVDLELRSPQVPEPLRGRNQGE